MKKKLVLFISLSMWLTAFPVFAAHDHGGGRDSMDHGASQDSASGQSAKEAETLLNSCAQQVASLQRRINRLQADMAGKKPGNSVLDELKQLEKKLKEANEIARPLQLF